MRCRLGAAVGEIAEGQFISLPQMKSVSCSMALFEGCGLPLSVFASPASWRVHIALDECFMYVDMCAATMDTVDQGWGWRPVSFVSSSSPTQEELRGKGKERYQQG